MFKLFNIVRTTDKKVMHYRMTRAQALAELARMNDSFRITGLFTMVEVL